MAARSYTVANEYFATQHALVSRVQAILHGHRPPYQLTGQDAALMADLVERHPSAERKIGCGIQSIWIHSNGAFGNGFFIERSDGTFEDFSYKQCIRPFTHATKAKFAFRRAIDEQVIAVKRQAFAQSSTLVCPILGYAMTWETSHVDHVPPETFAVLLARYCALRSLDLDTVPLIEWSGGIGKALLPPLAADWAAWHAQHAILRVISAEANIKLVR